MNGQQDENTIFPEQLLKAPEVAKILNISRAFAYQLMKQGEIRTVQIGAARRVRPDDLRIFIEEKMSPSSVGKNWQLS